MNEKNQNYRDKVQGLLKAVSSKETVKESPKPQPSEIERKIKEVGGARKLLPEIFKMEEAFQPPQYITEDTEEELPGTGFFRVKPPSSHTDADNYWNLVKPRLLNIGKLTSIAADGPGVIEVETHTNHGNKKVKIMLVRDSNKNDRPTLAFQSDGNGLTKDDVATFLERVGLKAEKENAKEFSGIVIMDAVE